MSRETYIERRNLVAPRSSRYRVSCDTFATVNISEIPTYPPQRSELALRTYIDHVFNYAIKLYVAWRVLLAPFTRVLHGPYIRERIVSGYKKRKSLTRRSFFTECLIYLVYETSILVELFLETTPIY